MRPCRASQVTRDADTNRKATASSTEIDPNGRRLSDKPDPRADSRPHTPRGALGTDSPARPGPASSPPAPTPARPLASTPRDDLRSPQRSSRQDASGRPAAAPWSAEPPRSRRPIRRAKGRERLVGSGAETTPIRAGSPLPASAEKSPPGSKASQDHEAATGEGRQQAERESKLPSTTSEPTGQRVNASRRPRPVKRPPPLCRPRPRRRPPKCSGPGSPRHRQPAKPHTPSNSAPPKRSGKRPWPSSATLPPDK